MENISSLKCNYHMEKPYKFLDANFDLLVDCDHQNPDLTLPIFWEIAIHFHFSKSSLLEGVPKALFVTSHFLF